MWRICIRKGQLRKQYGSRNLKVKRREAWRTLWAPEPTKASIGTECWISISSLVNRRRKWMCWSAVIPKHWKDYNKVQNTVDQYKVSSLQTIKMSLRSFKYQPIARRMKTPIALHIMSPILLRVACSSSNTVIAGHSLQLIQAGRSSRYFMMLYRWW